MITIKNILLIALPLTIIVYLLMRGTESFAQGVGPLSEPPFIVPADLPPPTPPGRWPNANWGYRNNVATLKTLLWEQNEPYTLMPNENVFAANLVKPIGCSKKGLIGYHSNLVNSFPVEKRYSECKDRPRIASNSNVAISTIPVTSW